jgi:UDP-N-acetylglucosamine 2-epimerase (non-hydrolysing)
MKIMTVLGTRPEIIRLSLVIERLDRVADHVLVHTGQNFDDRLSGVFFHELAVRPPDVFMGVRGEGFGEQAGRILAGIEPLLREHRPDRLLVLGDTNSGLVALVARRLGIPVYHMEAGNRCFDDRVPEEVNRRVIDHSSSVLMPYTERSRANLVREGIPLPSIYVTGNPILEVLQRHDADVVRSECLARLRLTPQRYFLVTAHRAENVDNPRRLQALVDGLRLVAKESGFPVVCSLHPRTKSTAARFGVALEGEGLAFVEPLGLFDFVALEKVAFCVLTDSGTVQEETCIFKVPNVTLRDVTERPETIDCGSNILAGCEDPDRILAAVRQVTASAPSWTPPAEYLKTNVADTVCRIVTGFRAADAAELEWQSGDRL